jgi:hypothetical protein
MIPRVPRVKIAHEETEHPFLSRKRALRLGLPKFFDPGDLAPCGHVAQRWAITGMCVRCAEEYRDRGPQAIVRAPRALCARSAA